MIRLLLVDYGEVISTPLPEDTITDLAASPTSRAPSSLTGTEP